MLRLGRGRPITQGRARPHSRDMKRVTSRHNALVARYRAVARGDDRSLILLDGVHLVADALAAPVAMRSVAVAGERADRAAVEPLLARVLQLGVEVVEASPSVMSAISPLRSPSDIVALADRPPDRSRDAFAGPTPLVVAAVGVQDPGNLGAMVRVAEAGGASAVVADRQSADPFGWKALRGAMGSALRLPVSTIPSLDRLLADARRHECRLVAAVPRGGLDPIDVPLHEAGVLLVGGEGQGLAAGVAAEADLRVTIPMAPPVESLNAAMTVAILVYEARRQRLASKAHGLALPARS
jgi:TrmH family RNA methyltransferase